MNNRTKRGFNLVEAAIVLGVIGLVIGGIWAAASALQTEHKSSQTMTAVIQASGIVRPLLTRHVMDVQFSQIESMTRTLLSGKLDGFNGDVDDVWGAPYAIGTPFGPGSSLIVDYAVDTSIWVNFNPIMIKVAGVPRSICYRLLHKFRAVMQGDPGGLTFAGLSTTRGSDDGWLGYYLPATYSPPSFNSPRYDNEDTMCSEATLNMNFLLVPMAN